MTQTKLKVKAGEDPVRVELSQEEINSRLLREAEISKELALLRLKQEFASRYWSPHGVVDDNGDACEWDFRDTSDVSNIHIVMTEARERVAEGDNTLIPFVCSDNESRLFTPGYFVEQARLLMAEKHAIFHMHRAKQNALIAIDGSLENKDYFESYDASVGWEP